MQVLVNGANLAYDNLTLTKGSYMELEAVDSDYAASHYPLDRAGNVYRCSTGNHNA